MQTVVAVINSPEAVLLVNRNAEYRVEEVELRADVGEWYGGPIDIFK